MSETALVEPKAKAAIRCIALAGNPNCGKTTLFNALTGLRQRVGNYPGVTVEKKVGRIHGSHGEPMEILDLPGSYSLHARSPDEAISRDVLLGRVPGTAAPDLIVAVVDASNLERNLYLVAQLLELGRPLIVALNMVDVAERAGSTLHPEQLAVELGVPVVPIVATTGHGLVQLKSRISQALPPVAGQRHAPMPDLIEREIVALGGEGELVRGEVLRRLSTPVPDESESDHPGEPTAKVAAAQGRLQAAGMDPFSVPIDSRYNWVSAIAAKVVVAPGERRTSFSDKLDGWLTHRFWGWVVFLAAMSAMFISIFSFSSYPMGWIEEGIAWLSELVNGWLPASDFRSLLTDGVLAGVGGVIVFLPQILILFLFLGLLEDSGYMARAAFIMDRLMSKAGLQGKSFIPMLTSFACAIPGVMAARSIESRSDRLVTILVAPLMSCSARLPVYGLMIAVLIPGAAIWEKAGIMMAMYALGVFVAFAMAWLFRKTLFRGERTMLVLELPPYRLPSIRSVLVRMWERGMIFVRRAGTVIFALSILLWAMATYPKPSNPEATPSEALAQSFAGRLGHAIEPVIAPLGYDWKIGIGLIASFAAREVFVGTMAIVYNVEEGDDGEAAPLRDVMLSEKTSDGTKLFTPLVCVGLMVFYVLAMQCISTVAIVRRETNSWRWPLFQIAYMTLLAYFGALVVYQGGRLFGLQ